MNPSRRSRLGALVGVLAVVGLAEARTATLKEPAKLRAGASATTELLGELPTGAAVEVVGEAGGWRQVETADGKRGYIWAEHLVEGAAEPKPDGARRDQPATAPRTLADEVRDLRAEIAALGQRPEPATAADVERVRVEVERLVAAERDLARRLEERLAPPRDPDPPPESTLGVTGLLLLAGAAVGWAMNRVAQRRRDFRQRNRLRL